MTDEQVGDAVREVFGVPASLDDPEAEAIVGEALERVLDGDVTGAHQTLADTFPTVCAREAPADVWVDDDQRASCHLVEPGDRRRLPEDAPATED